MAYVVSNSYKSQSYTPATSAQLSAANWPAHSANQLLVVVATQDAGNGVLSCADSGWVRQGTRTGTPAGATFQQIFTKLAASSSETAPTISSTISDDIVLQAFVVADVDTTTPVNVVSTQTDWNTSAIPVSATVVTTADDCLLIATIGSDASVQFRNDIDHATPIGQNNGNGNCSSAIFYRQLGAAGTTSAIQQYITTATEGGTSWVLAIKNSSGGRLAPDVRIDSALVNHYGNIGAAVTPVIFAAPEKVGNKFAGGFTGGLLNGVTVTATDPSVSSLAALTTVGTNTVLGSAENTAGSWVGGWHTIASTNMVDDLFSYEVGTNRIAGQSRIGAMGVIFGFTDGTNYQFFQALDFVKGWATTTPYRQWVSCGNTTPVYSRGTLDWSAITGLCYMWHRDGSNATQDSMYLGVAMRIRKMTLTGGNVASPVRPKDVPLVLAKHTLADLAALNSSAQVQIKATLQIGDGGTHKTIFEAASGSLEFPQTYSATLVDNWQNSWNIPANIVSVDIYAGASDSIDFSASALVTESRQNATINASSSTSAGYSVSGESIVGWDYTWKTGVPCAGATFKSCGKILAKGAILTDCTITKTVATDAAINWDTTGAVVTRTTIDLTGSTTDYHLELGASNTAITLADVTFTGTPGTDKVHVLAASGTVTITISGSTSLVAGDITSAGATVVIAAPQIYQSVTITNLVAGSRVQIYDTTHSTELSNSVAGGTSVTWTDSVAAASSRAIRVRIAYVSGVTAKAFVEASIGTCGVTEGTEAVSYLANQSNDTTYNTNAVDGSTITGITFTDAATDLVNVNIASGNTTWQNIYAAFAYWISTSVGITDDIAYVDGVDPANYLLTAMKIKNTSSPSVPLTITGGFGRDATSGTIADIIDTTGGNIYPLVDHVVSKVVTVGGVNVITGDIATVLAAIPSASANANAVWSKTLP